MLLRSSPPSTSFLRSLLREPLLHFVLFGGLVFAADHVIRSQREDPLEIVVGPEVDGEARATFRKARDREPTPSELQVLRERWVANEVLYREGLALRLDRGDTTLRERIIFKALNVIESNIELPELDEPALREWFDARRDRYGSEARFDFSEAVPTDRREETARRFVAALNGGAAADVESGLRIFEGRPRASIVDAFGAEFTDALEQAPVGSWQALPSNAGVRVVRLEAREPGEGARFDDVRSQVLQDWKDEKAQERRTAAVRELTSKYVVRYPESSP
jgi:nitrous oxide reductase accessory protein NosL